MSEIIKTGIVLMLYSLAAGASLAFVYIKTAPIIEANKMAATGDAVRAEVLPDMAGGYDPRGKESEFPYWTGFSDVGKKEIGGYIFITRRKGYSSTPIETMVGVDRDGTITGVKILFQQETPGLGDKIEEIKAGESDPWFPHQFIGKSASFNFNVTQDGGDIDAITGATISSRVVAASIINGINNLLDATGGEAFSQKIETAEITPETEQAGEKKEEGSFELPDVEAVAGVLPGMAEVYELKGEDTVFPYWTVYKDSGKTIPAGYIFIAHGKGFASIIETAVGVDPDGIIVGIKVLSHEETPGYGDKLDEIREGENEPWFPRQFIGKSASDTIALTEDGGDIDALSEATISSQAVTRSINDELNNLMDALAGKTFAKRAEPEEDIMEQLMGQTEEEAEEEPDDIMEQLMKQSEEE